ncbi:MAG: NAD(P)/FAD-dependent oxidoreductase [Dehalococcoidia bacterium]|nr:NAD(P)/FAD-dependent oxidoreductase [Dehalococcoidia bacterium]
MDVDVLVVGAGIVGLALAAELASDCSVVVVERHASYARETSSHNSGVIHSGIYYQTGSWKHRLCLEGNAALYDWCARQGVTHQRLGKLIVATSRDDLEQLEAIEARALANEVPGVRRLSGREARSLEPRIPAVEALFSGTTGIVDQMALARSFEAAARHGGATFAYRHRAVAGHRRGGMFHVKLLDDDDALSELSCRQVVNAAGHGAPQVAEALGYPLDGSGQVPVLQQRPNRGRYYDVVNPTVARGVRHLVYPVRREGDAGLGVHITLDVDGGMHLGPDAEWMTAEEPLDYRNDDSRRDEFVSAARRLLPTLRDADLVPGQVGYRPKLSDAPSGEPDFMLWHDEGYVHLGGIESPGLTASIAIARAVATMLRE